MGIDPVGDVPYFYMEHDTSRHLARNWGMLDLSADAYEWSTAAALAGSSSLAASEQPASSTKALTKAPAPPRRGQYPCGKAGRERFRDDRNQWYFDRTGKHLSDAGSSTKQQGEAFDLLARNYRMRGDRSQGRNACMYTVSRG